MSSAEGFLTDEERRSVEDALHEAEKRTSGEIVPVICAASGRYDRAEDTFGLLFAIASLGVFWFFLQGVEPAPEWSSTPTVALGFWAVALIVLVGFALGTALATVFPTLRLFLVPKGVMAEEVERRAHEAFTRFRVARTADATGILIFVSLYEHMVVVRGDEGIRTKLSRDDWTAVRDTIIAGMKSDDPAGGLVRGIEKCGELLAKHFPIQEGDENELANTLHFLEDVGVV